MCIDYLDLLKHLRAIYMSSCLKMPLLRRVLAKKLFFLFIEHLKESAVHLSTFSKGSLYACLNQLNQLIFKFWKDNHAIYKLPNALYVGAGQLGPAV